MKVYKKRALPIMLAVVSTLLPIGCTPQTSDPYESETFLQHAEELNPVTNKVVSSKKGVCVSRYNYGNDGSASDAQKNRNLTFAQSADKVKALDCGWYYNWSSAPHNSAMDESLEFVPMIWGPYSATDEVLADIKSKYESGVYTHLLTFNEPDLSVQSNMTVDAALAQWDKLEAIGIPLSSPAVSYYSPQSGNEWLDSFMTKADKQNKRVDFIAIHLYQSFYSQGVVNELKDTLTALYDKYKLPIWLTEFSSIDIISRDAQAGKPKPGTVSPNCTDKNAQNYLTQATNMLEQCGFVERYAWFTDNYAGNYEPERSTNLWEAPYSTLYNDDDTISDLGKVFKAVQSNQPLTLKTNALGVAAVDKEYKQSISVVGGTGNYTFTASGLPSGLKISGGGTVYGTAKQSGTYPVKVTVTDSGKTGRRQSLTYTYALTIK